MHRIAPRTAAPAVGAAVLLVLPWLLTGPITALDRTVAASANAWVAPRPVLVAVLESITALGSDLAAALVLGTLVAVLLVRRRLRPALYVALTACGGAVIAPAVKHLVGRVRPVVESPVASAPGPSFPSGHTLTATLWVGIVLLVLMPAVPARARPATVGAGVAIALLVGLTRIALGVHHLSDVVAGWVLGVAWLAVTATAFRLGHDVRGPVRTTGIGPTAAVDLLPAHDPRPSGVRRRIAARLLVVAVLLLGALTGLGQLVTRVAAGTAFEAADVGFVRAVAALRTPPGDALSVPAAELGNTGVVILGCAIAAVLAVAVLRRWRPAVFLVVAVAGETLLFMATASITGRTRPPVQPLDAQLPPTSSFPSGHTAAAVALYGAIALIVLGATRAWWRWLVVAVAVAAVVVVAAARLYRGAHHPSDVLGSLLLTVPWLLAVDRLLPLSAPARAPSPPRRSA